MFHTEAGQTLILPADELAWVYSVARDTNSIVFWDVDSKGAPQPYLMARSMQTVS